MDYCLSNYAVLVDEKTRDANNPQNRTDVGKPITKTTINN